MHPHHAAGRSPLSTQGHAFILTSFILQTLQLRDIHHNNYIIYNYWEMTHVLRNHSQFYLRLLEYFPLRLLEYFPLRLLECPRLLEYFPPPEELTESNSLRMLLLLPVASSEEQYHRLTLSGTYSLNWLYNSQMFFVTHYPIHAIFSRCSISLSSFLYITRYHTRDIQSK